MSGIYFIYEFNPITVLNSMAKQQLSHFFVEVSAIIGGVITIAFVLDKWLEKLFYKQWWYKSVNLFMWFLTFIN